MKGSYVDGTSQVGRGLNTVALQNAVLCATLLAGWRSNAPVQIPICFRDTAEGFTLLGLLIRLILRHNSKRARHEGLHRSSSLPWL